MPFNFPQGGATEATLAQVREKLDALTTPGDVQPVSGPLTEAQLRTTPVVVSGTVTATPTGTQAVSGPLTDAQARATPIPVSLSSTTVTGSVAVTGTVAVSNFPSSQAVTGSVGVAGTVAVSNLPATQAVSAAALPLPTGAATETTLAGALTTAAFQARHPAQGQALAAASVPVVLASDQGEALAERRFRQLSEVDSLRDRDAAVAQACNSRGRDRNRYFLDRMER